MGDGGTAPLFLTSALDEDVWSAPRPDRFTRGERARDTHLIGCWVGPSADLVDMKCYL
jgi:hypothetical protein